MLVFAAPAAADRRKARFGHLAYDVAPAESLAAAGAYRATGRAVRLRPAAAEAFRRMAEAAAADGVSLIPISGHRTREYQEGLFERARRKHGSSRDAARWVAPPGHSEHHTGWTLDLGDGAAPATDVDPSFEGTAAFRWLERRAAEFGFELSFPPDNAQGVGYEPWHWRYVGDPEARRLFRRP